MSSACWSKSLEIQGPGPGPGLELKADSQFWGVSVLIQEMKPLTGACKVRDSLRKEFQGGEALISA